MNIIYKVLNKARTIVSRTILDYKISLIAKLPRFKVFNTDILNGYILKGVDSPSFLFQFKEIFKTEIYKFAPKSRKPIIIDCGSNIGLSILYFKINYPEAKILGFECDKDIFEVLKFNVESNKLSEVKLIPKAVWIEETELSFLPDYSDGGKLEFESTNNNLVKVNSIRLKDFLNQEIDFLKIDIEGAEIEVIKDCQDVLYNVNNLFIEFHSYVNKPQNLSMLLNILEASGFRYYLSHTSVTSLKPFWKIESWENMDNQINIFAYRK